MPVRRLPAISQNALPEFLLSGLQLFPGPQVAIAAEVGELKITSPQDAVNRFAAETQLYVQGSPLNAGEMARLRSLLSQNPNIYVILIDYSTDVTADDLLLSRGIGESEAFRSGYNSILDQRDGVLFMIYFDSNQGRKIFMRAEELPDRLGVGEANFASQSGQPRELLNLFVNAVRNQGKDVPAALEEVVNRINETIRAAAQKVAEQKTAAPKASEPSPTVLAPKQTTVPPAPSPTSSPIPSPRGDRDYVPWLGGLMVLGSLTPAGLLNYRARQQKKQAEQQLAEARVAIDQKTQSLMALIEQADYAILDQYRGQTQQLSQQLIEDLGDALTLLGGTAKFLEEAEQLIHHAGVSGQFLTVGFERARALLSDSDTTLSFDLNDSTRAVLEKDSNAEVWRTTLLRQGKTRKFEKSLQDVLSALAENQASAAACLDEIQTKSAGIEAFLKQIEAEANQLVSELAPLQEASRQDRLFTLLPLTAQALPKILAQPKGLLAQGRHHMERDPVRAWDEFAEEAQRISIEAATLWELGHGGRSQLLPLLHQSVQQLKTHGIQLSWAVAQVRSLSEELEQLCGQVVAEAVVEQTQQLRQRLKALKAQIERVVAQDRERREVCPGLIETAERAVSTARQMLCTQLQQQEVFLQGQPEQLLRESGQDPSRAIQLAQRHLQQLPDCLNQGETEAADTHLTAIESLTQDAHQICQATQAALQSYPSMLQRQQADFRSISQRFDSDYRPVLERLQRRYDPEALARIATEIQSGTTIADNLVNAQNLLAQGQERLQGAVSQLNLARILAAVESLEEVERLLRGSQKQLDALLEAEARLNDLEDAVLDELQQAEGYQIQLQQTAHASYLRSPAHTAIDRAMATLNQARRSVQQEPTNPYITEDLLTQYEGLRLEAVAAIQADQRAYDAAIASLHQAERAIARARSEIAHADSQHFTYASVRTYDADQKLRRAEDALREAERWMQQAHYERADQQADQAKSTAQQAERRAEEAVRSAHRSHDSEVRRRNDEARRAAEAAAAQRSTNSSRNVTSSSRNDSVGDSGSTGGSW